MSVIAAFSRSVLAKIIESRHPLVVLGSRTQCQDHEAGFSCGCSSHTRYNELWAGSPIDKVVSSVSKRVPALTTHESEQASLEDALSLNKGFKQKHPPRLILPR